MCCHCRASISLGSGISDPTCKVNSTSLPASVRRLPLRGDSIASHLGRGDRCPARKPSIRQGRRTREVKVVVGWGERGKDHARIASEAPRGSLTRHYYASPGLLPKLT